MTQLTEEELASENRRATARKFFDQATSPDNDRLVKKDGWRELWTFRNTCKKGWDKLGFTPREVERIKLNKPEWM